MRPVQRSTTRAPGLLLAGGLMLAAQPALAHPHVFVDATVEVIFDAQGRAEALRIGWTYDEMLSLLVIEDRGLDTDYDGVLTDAETAALQGFDMAWEPGFAGDTYALAGEVPLALSGPEAFTAAYEGGKLRSSHLRRFDTPLDLATAELVVQVYDPSFYTAYTIVGTPVMTGRADCRVQVLEPDRAAADAILAAAIEELSGSGVEEAEFPAIGAAYSEEARISCGG